MRDPDNLLEGMTKAKPLPGGFKSTARPMPLQNSFNSIRMSYGEHDLFFWLDRNSENLLLFMNACAAAKEKGASLGTSLH